MNRPEENDASRVATGVLLGLFLLLSALGLATVMVPELRSTTPDDGPDGGVSSAE